MGRETCDSVVRIHLVSRETIAKRYSTQSKWKPVKPDGSNPSPGNKAADFLHPHSCSYHGRTMEELFKCSVVLKIGSAGRRQILALPEQEGYRSKPFSDSDGEYVLHCPPVSCCCSTPMC